jgi:hypothetical protein
MDRKAVRAPVVSDNGDLVPMKAWKMAWDGARAYGRASRVASESMQAALEQHAALTLPRHVRNRGYLAPGDPIPPPGTDLLDYSALAPARVFRGMKEGVALAAAIDLATGSRGSAKSFGRDVRLGDTPVMCG